MHKSICSVYSLVVNDNLQRFAYGVSIAALIYPAGYIVSLMAAIGLAIIKETLENEGVLSYSHIIFTFFGGISLIIWYKLIEFIKLSI
jgi:hypothetical protein